MPFFTLDVAKFILPVLAPLVTALIAYFLKLRNEQELSKLTQRRIEAAESRAEAEPKKSKPAWDLARATLEAYFNRNLSQISSIFWLSAVVMTVGFGTIIWGIFQAIQSPNSLEAAKLASLSGIVTEFIGATFLFIYRSTIQQAINYSKTLERINSVGMAMQILDTMPDEAKSDDLKSITKASIVQMLVSRSYAEKPEPSPNSSN